MASVSVNPTIYLSPSPKLISFLQQQDLASPPQNIQSLLDGGIANLSVEDISWLRGNVPTIPSSLLLSCQLLLPTPEYEERNPVLEERCIKLRAKQEEREYRSMTGNVRRDYERTRDEEPIKKQFKEVNAFLLLILQFVVSVVCSFMFGYLSPYYLYGRTDMGGRLLFGIICGFVVGCADMYFVIRQLLEDDGILLSKKID